MKILKIILTLLLIPAYAIADEDAVKAKEEKTEVKEEKTDDYTPEELEEALRYQLQRLEAFQKISKIIFK